MDQEIKGENCDGEINSRAGAALRRLDPKPPQTQKYPHAYAGGFHPGRTDSNHDDVAALKLGIIKRNPFEMCGMCVVYVQTAVIGLSVFGKYFA